MSDILITWLLSALAILAVAYLVPGVTVSGFLVALVVALVLGLLNAFLKPILVILTLPLNILTLGLFTLVINTVLVLLTAYVVPGFELAGFWWALVFSIALSLINIFFKMLSPAGNK